MKIGKFILLLIAAAAVFSSACVETLTNNPNQKPTITVTSPASGDTIQFGKTQITYSATDYSGGPGLSQYEVFVNGASNGVYQQNTDGTNPDLFLEIDSTLVGTKISYSVTVYNKDGDYGQSKTIDNIYVVKLLNPPEAPQNLSINILSGSEIILFWSDSNSTAESYEVWRKDGETGTYKAIKTGILPGSTEQYSYRDVGLNQFIVYFYKVRSRNAIGYSPFSNEVNTLNGGAPSNLTAEANGATIVYLTWKDNALDENGFIVERMMQGGNFEQVAFLPINSTDYTDTGLLPTTTYIYRVAALFENAVAYSNEATVTTFAQDIPAPSNLVATFDSFNNAVSVSWQDNTFLENGTLIERKENGESQFSQIGQVGADITTFLDRNITIGKLYTYRARHSTTEGFFTPYSNEDTVYIPVTPPNAPSNLRITSTTMNDVFILDWQDNADDEDGFELWAKKSVSGSWALFKSYPANTIVDSVKIDDPSKEWFFKLRSFRGSLNSAFSNEVSTQGSASGFTVNLITVTTSQVELRWQDVFDGEYLFVVERMKTSFPAETEYTEIGSAASVPGVGGYQTYIDTDNFQSFDTYLYRVRAKFSDGYSDYSNEVPVTIP